MAKPRFLLFEEIAEHFPNAHFTQRELQQWTHACAALDSGQLKTEPRTKSCEFLHHRVDGRLVPANTPGAVSRRVVVKRHANAYSFLDLQTLSKIPCESDGEITDESGKKLLTLRKVGKRLRVAKETVSGWRKYCVWIEEPLNPISKYVRLHTRRGHSIREVELVEEKVVEEIVQSMTKRGVPKSAAAKLLNISERAINKLIRDGKLDYALQAKLRPKTKTKGKRGKGKKCRRGWQRPIKVFDSEQLNRLKKELARQVKQDPEAKSSPRVDRSAPRSKDPELLEGAVDAEHLTIAQTMRRFGKSYTVVERIIDKYRIKRHEEVQPVAGGVERRQLQTLIDRREFAEALRKENVLRDVGLFGAPDGRLTEAQISRRSGLPLDTVTRRLRGLSRKEERLPDTIGRMRLQQTFDLPEAEAALGIQLTAPAPSNGPESRTGVTIPEDVYYGPAKLAELFQIPLEPLKKRLQRYQKRTSVGWIENADRKPREPQFLFEVGAVKSILEDLSASRERPAKKI